MTGSVMTFYELVEGDMAHLTGTSLTTQPRSSRFKPHRSFALVYACSQLEFYELPAPLLRRALDTLVKKGKAQVIKGEAEGVKFF